MQQLEDRALVRVSGEDAETFLHNTLTCDMRKVTKDHMHYALLLAPQGRILFDMFIVQDHDGYLLDIDANMKDALLKRLSMYKLRSKVDLQEDARHVFYSKEVGWQDPRLPELGRRMYQEAQAEYGAEAYISLCIQLTVPTTQVIRHDKDYPADVNLDLLGVLDWGKGCFIGQETVARMHNKGTVKRRLFQVAAANLDLDTPILNEKGGQVGEMRCIDTHQKSGLAILKLSAIDAPVYQNNEKLEIIQPSYLVLSKG